MTAKTIAFILLAVLLTLFTTPVYATDGVPPPAPVPHAFYGTVEVNGEPAPVGTEVAAMGDGVLTGVGGNPIVTTAAGKYGSSSNPFEPMLIVWGDIVEGATLTFYVNGVATGQTAEWHSEEVTEVNLVATIEGPPPEPTQPPPPEPTEPTPPAPALKPAAFSPSSLAISPSEAAIGESVTVSVEVANTGEQAGSYKLTLKIDGVAEASKDVTVNAGASQKVSFTTAKDLPGGYAVDINGLGGTFVVIEEVPPTPSAPSEPSPTPSAEAVNWPILWGTIGGVIMLGLIIFLAARRKAY